MKTLIEIDHPIFEACRKGEVAFVEAQLNKGVSVYAKSEQNPTLIAYAIGGNQAEIVKLLIRHGYDPSHPADRNILGETQLMQAVGDKRKEIVGILLDAGADVNAGDDVGITSLMRAAGGGNLELVKLLVERGANVNAVGTQNFTAFYFAADGGHIPVITYLFEKGADIDMRNADMETCLIRAARKGHLDAVDWLLLHGLDTKECDRRGQDARFWAEKNHHSEIAERLRNSIKA